MKIVIDAGHGNNTPGKRAPDDSMREFHFNSVVARYLDAELKNYEGVSTKFAHDPSGKVDVALKARTDAANKWGAKVYVSIHANALAGKWHTGGGIETFVYTTRPKGSTALASKVQAELIMATGLRNRGVKFANFHVLRETKMDAILVECGFMDNRAELALLKPDAYRRKCAKAIEEGLAKQYGLKRKASAKPVTNTKPSPTKPVASKKLYRVQIGAFSKKANADAEAAKAKRAGYTPYIAKEGGLFKVQIGAYSVKANADKMAAELKRKGFKVYIA